MKEHEKRGAQRVPYISDVVCESAGNRLTARTSDISVSGVFIHSKLWCEAGSILTLNFSVTSTRIETAGEVCYSIPHIGMGIRFLDLKPEYLAAIESLIESQRDQECDDIKTKAQRMIPSGVEPVDRLLGGLERGHLYLARGDASGKSLVGIAFLIEGLKRGQPGALITTQPRADAIRRFARFGYDCSRAVRSGALVIFTYSTDIVEQHLHLDPLLRELGPKLDKTSPQRIVFDPVDNILAGVKQDDVTIRANQLSVWVRSFGATVVLVANEEKRGIIESLTPSVRDSFRFEVRESSDRVVRMMSFEKSPSIPDQPVRVDPSRGIFLLEDQQSGELINEGLLENDENCDIDGTEPARIESDNSEEHHDSRSATSNITDEDWTVAASDPSGAGYSFAPTSGFSVNKELTSRPTAGGSGNLDPEVAQDEACDAFFAMLDELQSFVSEIDPDVSDAPDAGPPESINRRLPKSGGVRLQPQQLDCDLRVSAAKTKATMNKEERRDAKRVSYVCEVEFEGGGLNNLATRINDLSATGAFIDSMTCYAPGTHLKLRFRVHDTWIETAAEVRYTMPLMGMGVMFLGLEPVHLEAIERLIEGKPFVPPPPISDAGLESASTRNAWKTPDMLIGNFAIVSMFDVIQIIENNRLSGSLSVLSPDTNGEIHFNEGHIVDALCGDSGMEALKRFLDVTEGSFEFRRSDTHYPSTIQATDNMSLMLNLLRVIDEDRNVLRET